MRKPRLEDFDPNTSQHQLEEIDLSDITPIQMREIKVERPKSAPIFENGTTVIPRHHETMPPSNHDTVIPRHHDTTQAVRKAVRELGKEAATHRFTSREKQAVTEIIYVYRQQGIKTSENEITRIALNYLIENYRNNRETSILDAILRELNS